MERQRLSTFENSSVRRIPPFRNSPPLIWHLDLCQQRRPPDVAGLQDGGEAANGRAGERRCGRRGRAEARLESVVPVPVPAQPPKKQEAQHRPAVPKPLAMPLWLSGQTPPSYSGGAAPGRGSINWPRGGYRGPEGRGAGSRGTRGRGEGSGKRKYKSVTIS